ncbi:hypothetical protein K469DRAFT_81022 [Zopfia rhizophila CBS 207.26]|uniref:PARP-type domain-containing protein n=1 Tax=Zopfia rhizophila CBS 207.26 TaxID=1314779 RepID=A0A6A6DAB2_9PEZI|nr:hypothetical protein K469DRAFT_81022 [Zopfia rhizophila CBS 207.26]
MLWRHWGCVPPTGIKDLRQVSGDKLEIAPAFSKISPEGQEQVRLAFQSDQVVDKGFKDICEDLVKAIFPDENEIKNAVGHKIDLAPTGRAGCRNAASKHLRHPDCFLLPSPIKSQHRLPFR